MKLPDDLLDIIKFTLDFASKSMESTSTNQNYLETIGKFYLHSKGIKETCNYCGHAKWDHHDGYRECFGINCIKHCNKFENSS